MKHLTVLTVTEQVTQYNVYEVYNKQPVRNVLSELQGLVMFLTCWRDLNTRATGGVVGKGQRSPLDFRSQFHSL